MDNIISVCLEENKATLKFPRCNIEAKAYIGKNGLTNNKVEGDGKTPIGEFNLGTLLGMSDVFNKYGLEYNYINENMYWVDDIKSKYYNKLVDISKDVTDWKSGEHLIDYSVQYEYLIEVKTNPLNIPGKGSAIFLHCSTNNPTLGCVSIDKKYMKLIMENIDKDTKIKIYKK